MAFEQSSDFWSNRFGSPSGVSNWSIYSVEYIDDLSFMPLADQVLKGWRHKKEMIAAVGEKLKIAGWSGDGDFRVMWLPSFAGAGPSNDFGCYAFHIKQSSDGVSWVASPYALPFHRLFQPDFSEHLPAGNSVLENSKWRRGNVKWTMELCADDELKDENS